MVTRVANTSVALGTLLILYSGALTIQRYNPSRLWFSTVPQQAIGGNHPHKPERVVIKSAEIDTPVVTVPQFENRWELTPHGAAWLETSPAPGMRGNSILYGHNWSSIFLNLTKVKPGDDIEVYMSDGSRRIFVVTATQTVSPDAIGVLKPAKDRHLTLYTCTGFLDSKRFVVSATLMNLPL
jgi:LPXTG-site transpeptidase (sortase) family protein